jgi:hypothetical protein
MALATIFITIGDAENPILQRATNPVTSDQQLPVNISASIYLQIPQDYGSVWSSDMGSDGGYSYAPQFVQVLREYSAQAPITQDFSGCHDACSATVEAAGFALACSKSRYTPQDYRSFPSEDRHPLIETYSFPTFSVSINSYEGSVSLPVSLNITVKWAEVVSANVSGGSRMRHLVTKIQCNLTQASYDITSPWPIQPSFFQPIYPT